MKSLHHVPYRHFVAVPYVNVGSYIYLPVYKTKHMPKMLVCLLLYPLTGTTHVLSFSVLWGETSMLQKHFWFCYSWFSQGSHSCRWRRWIVMTATPPTLSCGSASWNRHPGFPPAKCSSLTPSLERFPSQRKVSPKFCRSIKLMWGFLYPEGKFLHACFVFQGGSKYRTNYRATV